ncbi:MAG: ABC transporter permease [Bdellovibrionaceae bacterium]|nr:ABC transporter permease [Pseudobdellovibrionaceae bacterium]MDW8190212.1 ABC transporter permease [Pseudobdellovibrionaceae bacterium]
MRGALVIFKKEMKAFLSSPNFLLVCGLMVTILSWVFPNALKMFEIQIRSAMFSGGFNNQSMNIHYGLFLRHLSYLNLILIFVVPALTMRLFSEEKKLKTFDLLLTSPITSYEIVLGKMMAALGAVLFVMLLSAIYPVSMAFFADFNWGTLLVAYFGIFLVASVYTAMDLFCSSLTESGIVAYVMAVIMNVFIWFVGMGVDIVDSSTARAIFEHISLSQHLSSLVEGTVRTTGIVYFLSLVFLFGFLNERVVESARWR